MLGSDVAGYRLNKLYKENLNEEEIINELDMLFQSYATKRLEHEPFGDFIMREAIV